MNTPRSVGITGVCAQFAILFTFVWLALAPTPLRSQGIPEPTIYYYGTIRNTNNNANVRWNFGTLVWRFTNQLSANTVIAPLKNVNDQFSFILPIPCETQVPGYTNTPNTIRLSPTPLAYNRANVFIVSTDGVTNLATPVAPAPTIVTLTSLDRGRIERVDLDVSIPIYDSDGNGMPEVTAQVDLAA